MSLSIRVASVVGRSSEAFEWKDWRFVPVIGLKGEVTMADVDAVGWRPRGGGGPGPLIMVVRDTFSHFLL